MLPWGFKWDVISVKEGDDRTVTLSPSEVGTLVSLMLNLKVIADNGGVPTMTNDKDAFDAHCDGLLQKLII